ncbi:DUF4307 domain-containing protein [Kitasatospora acidiphila]|uniref:DUF4307 domain-containing protein n=1 Tax=Kitasatospora acidiphila TaxID=2567942 RepID=A0A540W3Q2_9ACTN|nr:DUF4307 domain-containing protein [Kitasatospora acidiphila]TQF03658.1 DUF4307 domain-containing protein [Kitasatospora acidiphila]
MTATSASQPGGLPEGRYGGRSDQEADRRLKVIGAVLGVLVLALIAWLGGSYLMRESKLSGAVAEFQVVSDSEVQAQLSVTKSSGTGGTCTIRSEAADHSVVGQLDVPVPTSGSSFIQVVTIRTTARGTTAELLGCTPSK